MTREEIISTIVERWKKEEIHPTEYISDLYRNYRHLNPSSILSESQRLIWEEIGI